MQNTTTKPQLLLNFDVNGTLILKDTSKKVNDEYMLISALAETTFDTWDKKYKPMTFKQYVYNVLLPGDKSNASLKKERQKVVATFLEWLNEKSHPAKDRVSKEYESIKEKFTDPKTKKFHFKVFPSFYVLLEKLRSMQLPFTIILRTFGHDLEEVVEEIKEHPLGVKITYFAKFEKGSFQSKEKKTIEKAKEIYDIFLKSNEHFAIKDDWQTWNEDKERGRSGKPFLYNLSGRDISLLFDDNITGEEQDIACPYEINGKHVSPKSLCNHLMFPVNTKEAMLNDQYFIERVLKALKYTNSGVV